MIGSGSGAALLVAAVSLAGFMLLALWHVAIDDERCLAQARAAYHLEGLSGEGSLA